jgi:hypothetical protein
MKPGIILPSFSAAIFVFTLCLVVGANLSLKADTPRVDAGAVASLDKKPQYSSVRVSQKGDRLVPRNDYTKLEVVPPTELMVEGIATGDLLNVRMRPSPGATIVARLDNGALVKKLGCQEIAGHQWCLVELTDGGRQTGWVAGRYLKTLGEQQMDN